MRPLRSLLIVFGAMQACSDASHQPFQFDATLNNRTNSEVKIVVDGAVVSDPAQTIDLPGRVFDSYDEALMMPIRIETRRGDVAIATCDLYPGACKGKCLPERETASVCIYTDGSIQLNTWDCPCDDEIDDWFCGGDCSLTAPDSISSVD